jgi:hypothetical protein
MGDLERKAGLAYAAGPEQGYDPEVIPVNEGLDLAEFIFTPE